MNVRSKIVSKDAHSYIVATTIRNEVISIIGAEEHCT